jgi:hypothetical protein
MCAILFSKSESEFGKDYPLAELSIYQKIGTSQALFYVYVKDSEYAILTCIR